MKTKMKTIRDAYLLMVNNGKPFWGSLADAEIATVGAAIDELVELRTKETELSEAIVKWRAEAAALSRETGSVLTQLRREFGHGVESAWSMGAFTGPCAHGRDPYTRCDSCGEMDPREAFVATLREGK
jgi:hypothetical protein